MELKSETIEGAVTHMPDRVLGKTHVMGAASFTLRALTNDDQMYVTAVQMACDPDVRIASAVEMVCRLGIDDWQVKRRNGSAVKCERKELRRGGPLAITQPCIQQIPYDVQYELFGEILTLRDLSEDEGMRLDFTSPAPDA
jgi:hypothetical protein